MAAEVTTQLALLVTESVLVCGLLLLFFRLRQRFGLSLLYITLGTFQHLQTELAASLFVEIAPGILISPGSAVLFTATLFVILLVYIREDAAQARSLIVGVVVANLTLSAITLITSWHLASPLTLAPDHFGAHFLTQNLQAFIVGTGLLVLDVVLIIVLYEFFYRVFPTLLIARVFGAMSVVVLLDTVVFVSASFYGHENFQQILISGITGKLAAAALYSIMLTVYLHVYRIPRRGSVEASDPHDVFHILTYRQRYDKLKDELTRDHLTGLFNRRFFDDNLERELRRAARLGHGLNVVIYDLDYFKRINDEHGHATGDRVLQAFADAARRTFRAADIPCRYGGEEFVVIMPDSSAKAAVKVSARLQDNFVARCRQLDLPVEPSFTAGVASCPTDGTRAEALLAIADTRLYEGKRAGRQRVISAQAATPLASPA